jgi:phosphoadenylyl-sulfate reductase (thioredoxin)
LGTRLQSEPTSAQDLIAWVLRRDGRQFAVITSFQREGMVILDMAVRIDPRVRILTIDTGRLPGATHELIAEVERHYGIAVETVAPEPREVDAMVQLHGADLFRNDVALRMLCCQVRKVRAMDRALTGLKSFAVGLRREQSETRSEIAQIEEIDGRLKISPLAHWTSEEVSEYIARNGVPEHPLYSAGYATIGCDPCTRAIADGEEERAGRWWWETEADKECGLHFTADGRAMRRVDVLLDELLSPKNA